MLSQPHYLFRDGLRIAYYTAGNPNNPAVFLLHGFCMSAQTNWQCWIDKLIDTHYVIALDLRGHGRSDKPHDDKYYPASIMATDVVAVADALDIQTFSLIGYSMGARIATFIASAHPKRVNTLVIAGQAASLVKGIEGTDAIALALRASNLRAIKHPKLRQFRMLAEMGKNDLVALAHCIDAPTPPITIEHLANIKAKTLIIVGEDDAMAGDPAEVLPHFQQATTSIIADCNHFTAVNHPQFVATSTDFVTNQLR